MAKANRTCKVCGKSFYFCNDCSATNNTGISAIFDTEKCKDIFNTLSQNYLKKMTDEEALNKLNSLDIDRAVLIDSVKAQVKDLKGRTKKVEPVDIDFKPEATADEQPRNTRFRRKSIIQDDEDNIQ